MNDAPVIIEAAINGANRAAPRSPVEIAASALACFDAGAAIIHNHIDMLGDVSEADMIAARYLEGWEPVLAAHPDALFYPSTNGAGDIETRFCHMPRLAAAGAQRIGLIDPGSVNVGGRFVYVNSGSDIEYEWALCDRYGLVPSLAIFEPGFLRAALAYWRVGRLPPGTMIRFYFGGPAPESGGRFWFGLPPTVLSLDAYLAMLGDCPLPWSVAVLGGDLFDTELPRAALERGGHLRVGLEDYEGEPATNDALVARAAEMCNQFGRPVASCAETASLLGLSNARGDTR